MHEQVATVKTNGRDAKSPSAGEPDGSGPGGQPQHPERPGAKFTYPGGSRPLEGYTIKRGIGHGGFGEIYYAHSDAGKEVALKLIRRNLDVELRGIRQCLNLKHPNLLSLFDIRQDDEGDTWVVMEYVSGGCLADAMVSHPEGMPPDQALTWFHGTAAGVAHLHDRGIVHRDLKPGNIFCEEGLVKVGDYGLSKFISCSRRSGQTESVGTVHYMAPEVANGRYGKEIDIYAMGVILYEILTGRVPFEGESVGEVLMKHLTAKPDVSMLAEPYRSVVAKALEKDPAKRFRSVAEMVAALPVPAQAPLGTVRLPSGTYGPGPAADRPLPVTEKIVKAELVDEEPVLKAVRDTCSRLHTAWVQANLTTPVKVLILVAVILAVALNGQWLVPLAVAVVILYGVYLVVRALVLSGQARGKHPPGADGAQEPVPQPNTPAAAPPQYGPSYGRTRPGQRRHHWRRREEAAAALVVKSPRERLTELAGSLLAGSLVAVAMGVVMVLTVALLAGEDPATARPEHYAWMMFMSIACTWAVLIPAKFWEGTRGDATVRRFIMMVTGLGLGALAFGLASMLMIEQVPDHCYFLSDFFGSDRPINLNDGFRGPGGQPLPMGYLATFGSLFLLMRWWRQSDPLRPSRLRLWSMFVTVAVAGMVAWFWGFPESWMVVVGGAVSASVQLASPWVSPRERTRKSVA